jgi:predicted membrane metal-binding protein
MDLHEDLRRRTHGAGPSDRGFGLVFAAAFLLIGLWPLKKGAPVRMTALAAGASFLILSLAWPRILHPLNRVWTLFGLLLSRIMTPIVTTVIFGLLFVPAGIAMRLAGKDLLRLRRDPALSSYWMERAPPGPPAGTMANQF